MIVVKLIGGLGNQLFQYAAGRALANYHKTDLALDTSYLKLVSNGAYTQRKFELEPFNISASIANEETLKVFNFNQGRIITRLKKISPGLFNNMIFNEHHFNFHSEFLKLPKDTFLNGYWQSEKYFNSIRNKLLHEITLKESLSTKALLQEKQINEVNSVALHVRRGDFVSLKSANHFHGYLDIDYYKVALEQIKNKVTDPVFFIFSDDMDWCKENLAFINKKEFVDGKANAISTQEELILMSRCKHTIIANSSFSWWGAWLNQNKSKTVIAPKNWFADKKININDLIPADWIKM